MYKRPRRNDDSKTIITVRPMTIIPKECTIDPMYDDDSGTQREDIVSRVKVLLEEENKKLKEAFQQTKLDVGWLTKELKCTRNLYEIVIDDLHNQIDQLESSIVQKNDTLQALLGKTLMDHETLRK